VILDSSAIVAILFDEQEAPVLAAAIGEAETLAVSAATLMETTMVAEGRTRLSMREKLDDLLATVKPEVVAFTAEHAEIARAAWRRFGKGRHPAKLNLGDCFAYALAEARGEPLLFKGEDFARTDVRRAV
jgi:ribonuclease VapC